ncbi:RlpA-like double-psi beta-barrel-protein domain-containing protein-containing protein [Cantharellus anzutake]|uniref:RlpA-like double-psi beta-barrel-protein domain-containing protein-containing protein n=1 Tax=Cantharellus anzutake TaxID=1750568 RepID=UPI001908ADA7|nr:RlpA-like double-psi beta-barrel-protein domain-containing protein-containing protein [Cantharellus anzutake]KAF8331077.1 RlpA-like double-psi beta-barrel-protein domain-containing protein-containing protein [Cantharellus anzutake]
MNAFLSFMLFVIPCAAWTIPGVGFATMTHYYLPMGAIAACGCTADSNHFPTAALSSLAYGSLSAYGPGCGRCFHVRLVNTIASDPIWYPANPPSLVIKITDECPDGGPWCNATEDSPNAAGLFINFDLAWQSRSEGEQHDIPYDWFPSNVSYYGYDDFGVWNVSYTAIPCKDNWAGWNHREALGSVSNLGPDAVCCPADPLTYPNTTCPSHSDGGVGPNTTNHAVPRISPPTRTTLPFMLPMLGITLLEVLNVVVS